MPRQKAIPSEKKKKYFNVNVSEDELRVATKYSSDIQKMPLSTWVRHIMFREIQKYEEERGIKL